MADLLRLPLTWEPTQPPEPVVPFLQQREIGLRKYFKNINRQNIVLRIEPGEKYYLQCKTIPRDMYDPIKAERHPIKDVKVWTKQWDYIVAEVDHANQSPNMLLPGDICTNIILTYRDAVDMGLDDNTSIFRYMDWRLYPRVLSEQNPE
jgi:hypothetical protein